MKIFLNLLPPERKEQMTKRFYWRYFLGQWFMIFLIALLALFVMGGLYFQVTLQEKNQKESFMVSTDSERQKEYENYQKTFEEASRKVKQGSAFLSLHTSFSFLFDQLESTLPEGVRIEKVSTQSYKVFLTGSADTRENFLRFQDALQKNTCFESLNVPLSNLFSENDVQFQVDFLVKKECLRGSVPKI